MRQEQYNHCRTTVGTGRYRDTPIGNVPLSYLFVLRRWGTSTLFGDESRQATTEIALRRTTMQISTRTIRAIELLGLMAERTTGIDVEGTRIHSAEVLHRALYSKHDRMPNIAGTQAILNRLTKARIIDSMRGSNGGYYLIHPNSDINISSIDRLFRKVPNDRSKVGRTLRRKIYRAFRDWSVEDVLTDCHIHQQT